MTDTTTKIKKGPGFLGFVERVGNALPHPASLFGLLAISVLLLSCVDALLHWSAIHPATGEDIRVINLLSRDGLHQILLKMVDNYTGFAPLGIVMVAMLGIGVAESSGLITAAVRSLVLNAPTSILIFVLVFTGILSNVASDLGYILIIPIAGIIFLSIGWPPPDCWYGCCFCRCEWRVQC